MKNADKHETRMEPQVGTAFPTENPPGKIGDNIVSHGKTNAHWCGWTEVIESSFVALGYVPFLKEGRDIPEVTQFVRSKLSMSPVKERGLPGQNHKGMLERGGEEAPTVDGVGAHGDEALTWHCVSVVRYQERSRRDP